MNYPIPNLPIQKSIAAALALTASAIATAPAQAISLNLNGHEVQFNKVSGDFEITGGEVSTTQSNSSIFSINQNVTGPDIDLIMSIQGLPNLKTYNIVNDLNQVMGKISGLWFQSVVTNSTKTVWSFFDHELQETLGTPSLNGDGLSFAQGLKITPTSDGFGNTEQVIDLRDFINFSGGTVNPGETVAFNYFITDTTPIDRFYLRQRPNFQVGESVAERTAVPEGQSVPGLNIVLGLLGLVRFGTIQSRRKALSSRSNSVKVDDL